jgi:hypothetical protein
LNFLLALFLRPARKSRKLTAKVPLNEVVTYLQCCGIGSQSHGREIGNYWLIVIQESPVGLSVMTMEI